MKLLIFSNTNGDFEYINKLLIEHKDIDAGISLGDMYLYSASTPIQYFLRSKFRHLGQNSINLNSNGFGFVKPVFGIYGELDDPFIPANEFRINNLFLYWQWISDFLGHNEDRTQTKKIRIGFLGGYFNPKKFSKYNTKRNKMSRERQSLALCHNDFNIFKNNKLDILFSHDTPLGYPYSHYGSESITNLINKTQPKLIMCGHHREYKNDLFKTSDNYEIPLIEIPTLDVGYAIVNIFEQKYSIFNDKEVTTNVY